MKATHYGTCQICGNKQKAPDGVLSNHGYTVNNGFFNDICFGAYELPFEQDRKKLGQVMNDFAYHIENKQAYLNDVKADRIAYKVPVTIVNKNFRFMKSKKMYVDFINHKNEDGYDLYEIDFSELGKEYNFVNIMHQYKKLDNGNVQFQEYYGEDAKHNYVYILEMEIKRLWDQYKVLQDRYESWSPKELEPVEG